MQSCRGRVKSTSREELGMHMLEASVGIFIAVTLLVFGVAIFDGVNRFYALQRAIDSAIMDQRNVTPLTIETMTTGDPVVSVNEASLASYADRIEASLNQALQGMVPNYMFDFQVVAADINPSTGLWSGTMQEVASRHGGSYVPEAEILHNSELSRHIEALLELPLTLAGDSSAGIAERQVSLMASTAGGRDMGGDEARNFTPFAVLIGIRAALDLGDGLTGKLWAALRGHKSIYVYRAALLRGDFA